MTHLKHARRRNICANGSVSRLTVGDDAQRCLFFTHEGNDMAMNRRDFGKVMLGVTGGLLAGAEIAKVAMAGEEAGGDDHVCKGHNACKGKGGCKSGDGGCAGKNSCKGKGGCATNAKHDCAGKNACKGQGGCKGGDAGCAGKNSCKGKGGCKVPVDASHHGG
jgi:hypothetical protein